MSGLQKRSTKVTSKVRAVTAHPPVDGDFEWDGVDEDERPLTKDEMRKGMRGVGRPKSENPKEAITIRLSPEICTYFRATGKGWQTRLNAVLKDYVQSH
jgi:uncharacterized protein (DUF4415 family)